MCNDKKLSAQVLAYCLGTAYVWMLGKGNAWTVLKAAAKNQSENLKQLVSIPKKIKDTCSGKKSQTPLSLTHSLSLSLSETSQSMLCLALMHNKLTEKRSNCLATEYDIYQPNTPTSQVSCTSQTHCLHVTQTLHIY